MVVEIVGLVDIVDPVEVAAEIVGLADIVGLDAGIADFTAQIVGFVMAAGLVAVC